MYVDKWIYHNEKLVITGNGVTDCEWMMMQLSSSEEKTSEQLLKCEEKLGETSGKTILELLPAGNKHGERYLWPVSENVF